MELLQGVSGLSLCSIHRPLPRPYKWYQCATKPHFHNTTRDCPIAYRGSPYFLSTEQKMQYENSLLLDRLIRYIDTFSAQNKLQPTRWKFKLLLGHLIRDFETLQKNIRHRKITQKLWNLTKPYRTAKSRVHLENLTVGQEISCLLWNQKVHCNPEIKEPYQKLPNCTEQSPSWEPNSRSRNSLPFMKPEGSMSCSQKPVMGHYPEPDEPTFPILKS
jgi:hypothetical protein